MSGPGGEYAFALFSIGVQWFALALMLPGVFSKVLLPRLVRVVSVDAVSSRVLVKDVLLMTLVSASVVALVGAFLGPWLIGFYGTTYQENSLLIVVYLIAAVLTAPAIALGNAFVAHSLQWFWLQ